MLRVATFGVLAALLAVLWLAPGTAAPPRSTGSGGFLLELEGNPAGRLASAAGGNVTAAGTGAERLLTKEVGLVRYEPITVECEPGGIAKPFQAWIQATLSGKAAWRSGAIVELDAGQNEVRRLQFSSALITQVKLPAMDASAKAADRLTVRFQPEMTRAVAGTGARPATAAVRTTSWLPANFRLAIDGVDTTRVSRIEPLVITQKIAQERVGQERVAGLQPVALEIGNLAVSVPEAGASALLAWQKSLVLQPNDADAMEKKGTLTLLGPDLRQPLLTVELRNLGISRLTTVPSQEGPKRYRVEMYCKWVGLVLPP